MVRFDCRNSTGLGETDIPPSREHTMSHAHQDPGEEVTTSWSLGQTSASTGGFPAEAGAVAVHCGDKDTDGRCFKDYPLA